MKALTIRQPYASLIAAGIKTIETRSWRTHHRGPLLIHAGAKPMDDLPSHIVAAARYRLGVRPVLHHERLLAFPLGRILAVVFLGDCVRIGPAPRPHVTLRHSVLDDGDPDATPSLIAQQIPPLDRPNLAFGDFSPGRWAWLLSDARVMRDLASLPPVCGKQGLWNFDETGLVTCEGDRLNFRDHVEGDDDIVSQTPGECGAHARKCLEIVGELPLDDPRSTLETTQGGPQC